MDRRVELGSLQPMLLQGDVKHRFFEHLQLGFDFASPDCWAVVLVCLVPSRAGEAFHLHDEETCEFPPSSLAPVRANLGDDGDPPVTIHHRQGARKTVLQLC